MEIHVCPTNLLGMRLFSLYSGAGAAAWPAAADRKRNREHVVVVGEWRKEA